MKYDRKPEYHRKDQDVRIVSRANGLWAVQHNTHNPDKDGRSNKRDYWADFFGASKLSYEQAVQRMNAEAKHD